jgi:thioredoxin 1
MEITMTCFFVAALCVAAFVLPLPFAAAAQLDDPPPVFDKRPYAGAKKAAEDANKWFIVKATAVWCAPCKMMDRTTWRDEKVVKWFEANGIVVALDVDAQQKLAEDLAIQAMPTMIAFKEGKEFDRIVGYKSAADFLGWLDGIARGEKSAST